jgi:mannose-6-phosphate isomerase
MTMFWSLEPHLVSKVWGGEKLKSLKGFHSFEGPLGETWEVSRLSEGCTAVRGLGDEGHLSQLTCESELPYLVKFIDTTDNLSVQVHPGDSYAKEHENSKGKTECWLILDAVEGSGIYLGLKPNITKEQFKKSILEKEDLSQFMNYYPVKKGDFFYVSAGSIHAIGSGVTLAEIQQSSGVTYRVWDWNRVGLDGKERELHIEKALQVIEFENEKNSSDFFQMKKSLLSQIGKVELVRHEDFNVDLYNLSSSQEEEITFGTLLGESGRINSFVNISQNTVVVDEFKLSGYCSTVLNPKENVEKVICRVLGTKENQCSSFLHIY